jgi:hypothetical protein
VSVTCTLYEIEYELIYLLDTLEGLPPEEEQDRLEIEETIRRAVQAEIQKVDGISHMLAHFESQAQLAAAESKRLQARRKAFERSGERLELYLRSAMDLAGVKKLEGQTTTLSLRSTFVCPDHQLRSNTCRVQGNPNGSCDQQRRCEEGSERRPRSPRG